MLELHVRETKVQSSVVPVSWCTDRETLVKLRQYGRGELQLVIVVAPEENYHPAKEQRYLVPFKDGMAYVDLHHKGANNIFAFVPLVADPEQYVRRDGRSWNWDILQKTGPKPGREFRRDFLHRSMLEGYEADKTEAEEKGEAFDKVPPVYDFRLHFDERSAALRVEVPKEAFAPEPPEWEKKWVNWLFGQAPVDQCAYRRRRIVAYVPFLKPLAFVLIYAIRALITLFFASFLTRGVNFGPISRPLVFDTDDIWRDLEAPAWAPDKESDSAWRWLLVPVTPAFMAIGWTAYTFLGARLMGFEVGLLGSLLLMPVFVVALLLAVGAVVGVIGLLIWGARSAASALFGGDVADRPVRITREEEDYLVCGGAPRFSVGDLPPDRRTVRLRFQALRAKVCRPFSA